MDFALALIHWNSLASRADEWLIAWTDLPFWVWLHCLVMISAFALVNFKDVDARIWLIGLAQRCCLEFWWWCRYLGLWRWVFIWGKFILRSNSDCFVFLFNLVRFLWMTTACTDRYFVSVVFKQLSHQRRPEILWIFIDYQAGPARCRFPLLFCWLRIAV